MSFKKVKVVILPTNEKSKLVLSYSNELAINWTHDLAKFDDATYQNLYFLSDEEIKEGDWCVDKHKVVFKQETDKIFSEFTGSKKIIATTDKSIILPERFPSFTYLPQPSTSFIEKFVEEYNKGNVIAEVMVEYENYYASGALQPNLWQLKINPKDNTITIRKVKDSWNRDEVEDKIRKGAYVLLNGSIGDFDKWIEENL